MEASEQPGHAPEPQEPGADAPEQEGHEGDAGFATTTGADPQTSPVNETEDTPAADSDERNPAREQAPVASDAQDAVIGDPGLRDEQQPVVGEGGTGRSDAPVRTSAPPPGVQSGTPLPEEREGSGSSGSEDSPSE